MPTYGYQCTQCEHEFSVFQAMKDEPVKICPECGCGVKRLLYPVGIVFKGSGWYINDSRKPDKSEAVESAPAVEKKADSPETKADSSETKSSETAPATTSTAENKS